MIAHRRADVADLNARARERMRAAGRSGPSSTRPPARSPSATTSSSSATTAAAASTTATAPASSRSTRTRRARDRTARTTASARPRASSPNRPAPATRRSCTATRSPATSPRASPSTTPSCSPTSGIDREWAYVALSRGRHSNRLYVAAAARRRPRRVRAGSAHRADPIERLARQLERSSAQVLAIDSGQRPSRLRRRARAATRERRRSEHRRFGWLPGRRRELERLAPREADSAASGSSASTARRPFATEAEFGESVDSQHERQLDEPPSACCDESVGWDGSCDRVADAADHVRRPRRQPDESRASSARGGARSSSSRRVPSAMARLVELLEASGRSTRSPLHRSTRSPRSPRPSRVSPKVVRGAITRGELAAVKRGGRWIISAEAVRAWAQLDGASPAVAAAAAPRTRRVARSAPRSPSCRGRILGGRPL